MFFDSVTYEHISNQNFTANSAQYKFLGFVIFSKMRRQKYIFDFKFEISVKFRVERCISLYDSLWICLRFPMKSFLREDIQNIGKIGNLNMNHMVIYIIRREILRWFRIWSQKYIFAYAF